MTADQLKQLAIDALEDIKGQDIKILDVSDICDFTDFMVICSGTSNRHVKALADNVIETAKKHQVILVGVEGMDTAEWILVDLGDVIVHIMQPQTRTFYQLEQLWSMQPDPQHAHQELPLKKKWK